MPKIKTHKAAAKRFGYTGTGKLVRTKIGKSNLRRRKPNRVKALFSERLVVTQKGTTRRIVRLAPYLKRGS